MIANPMKGSLVFLGKTLKWSRVACRDLLLFLLVAPGLTAIAQTPQMRSPNEVIPPQFFGMHFHRADSGTAWPGLEIGAWRLWDAYVIWVDIQPSPEKFEFGRLDRYVNMARLAKAEVLYPLGMTPQWASARPTEKGVYRAFGDKAEPLRISDWERMIRAVVRRYKGRISAYELWNEVNPGMGFFTGTPESMLELQKSAYRVIKEEDAGALFVGPSVVGNAPHLIDWFEKYLALGAAAYADVISYHFYQPEKPPEDIVAYVLNVRTVMARNGAANKPLWNTESGYRMALGQTEPPAVDANWPALSLSQAEGYVARTLVLAWWAGIDRFYWYTWDGRDMGFLDPKGAVTPAGRAYLATARWLTGARLKSCKRTAPIWICNVERNGRDAWMVWNEKDEITQWQPRDLPALKAGETLAGEPIEILRGRPVKIDGRPVLLWASDGSWVSRKE